MMLHNDIKIHEINQMHGIEPLVSVCMITYNHEDYISQAIEGVLMQQTNFPIELVIGEDCSTDRTRDICLEYQKKYPNIIRLLLPEKNIGMVHNFIITLTACKGKYVALCEGDDYWTDLKKLQKQINFLETNSIYSACCHNVKVIDQIKKNNYSMWPWNEERDFFLQDLALSNKISTLSLVFRNNQDNNFFLHEVFKNYPNSPIGDYILNLYLAKKGKIKYFPQEMGVYRIHSNSNYSTLVYDKNKYSLLLLNWIQLLISLSKYFEGKIKKNLFTQLMYYADELRFIYYKSNNLFKAFKISILQLKYLRYWEKNKIRLFFSIIYRLILMLFKKLK